MIRCSRSFNRCAGVIAALLASGCSLFHHQEERVVTTRAPQQFRGEERPVRADGQGIRAALNLQPQLRLPCKIAVYLQAASKEENRLEWMPEDKELIQGWESALRRAGIASELFLMSDIVVDEVHSASMQQLRNNGSTREGGENPSRASIAKLRLAAAKHGASTLLVLRGSRSLDEYFNPLAALYITIVGYFIVPGSHVDATVSLDGALFDVANEYLYVSLDAQGKGESFGPGAILEGDRATSDAKKEALSLFGEALYERMARLR